MMDVKDYLLEYKRKIPNILLLWVVILVFITIFIIIINNNFKITNYYQIKGIVGNGKINITVPIDNIKSVINSTYLYINDEKYKYKVVSMDKNIIEEKNVYYQKIILDINLKDKIFIENNIIELKFIVSKETILEYIYNLFRG